MNIVLTGASGMVGQGVLLECIDNPDVDSVLCLNRRSIPNTVSKVKELVIPDLANVSSDMLAGYDACFFCAGISAMGLSEDEYTHITYDLTLAVASAFLEANANSVMCYVSGAGTDSTEKGRMMWARVKGKTENALLAMPFREAYMLRPGYIQPLRGIRSKTNLYQTLYTIFKPIYIVLKHFPSTATNTANMGVAMLKLAKTGHKVKVLGNKEINEVAKEVLDS